MDPQSTNGAPLGIARKLFSAANTLRGSMDSSDYKHDILGLIFLKHISDRFETKRTETLQKRGSTAAEDRDRYLAENLFSLYQKSQPR